MKKSLIPLIVFIVIAVFLGIGLKLNPRDVPSPLIDKPVPQFSLPYLDQKGAFTPEQLKGQVWLLNVWASWCVSCRAEHPVLNRLATTNAVTLVGFNYKDTNSAAIRWLQQHGDPYNFTIVDADGRIGIDWGVYGVPETFLVDKEGFIRYKHTGPLSDQDVQQILLPKIQQWQEAS